MRPLPIAFAVLYAGAAILCTPTASTAAQEAKLLASDGVDHDRFGLSVSIDRDTALIGAFGNDEHGESAGKAYIFVLIEHWWAEQAILVPSDPIPGIEFGVSVAIDGDTALVGAFSEFGNLAIPGAAYVFTRSDGVWSQQAKLQADGGVFVANFGGRVALDGDTALVSAWRDDDSGVQAGSVYVFQRDGGGWTQQAKLLASDAAEFDFFGDSIAIDGNTAVVGATGVDDIAPGAGAAYVFTRTGNTWTEQAKLQPPEVASYQLFGASVAVDADSAVVGAPRLDVDGVNVGGAYVFRRSGTAWAEQARLIPSDPDAFQGFGHDVSIADDLLLIGSPYPSGGPVTPPSGSAYLFFRTQGTWTEQARLQASDGSPGNKFGYSVDFSSDTAMIGAFGDHENGFGSGAAYAIGPLTQLVPATTVAGTMLLVLAVLVSGSYLLWRRSGTESMKQAPSRLAFEG